VENLKWRCQLNDKTEKRSRKRHLKGSIQSGILPQERPRVDSPTTEASRWISCHRRRQGLDSPATGRPRNQGGFPSTKRPSGSPCHRSVQGWISAAEASKVDSPATEVVQGGPLPQKRPRWSPPATEASGGFPCHRSVQGGFPCHRSVKVDSPPQEASSDSLPKMDSPAKDLSRWIPCQRFVKVDSPAKIRPRWIPAKIRQVDSLPKIRPSDSRLSVDSLPDSSKVDSANRFKVDSLPRLSGGFPAKIQVQVDSHKDSSKVIPLPKIRLQWILPKIRLWILCQRFVSRIPLKIRQGGFPCQRSSKVDSLPKTLVQVDSPAKDSSKVDSPARFVQGGFPTKIRPRWIPCQRLSGFPQRFVQGGFLLLRSKVDLPAKDCPRWIPRDSSKVDSPAKDSFKVDSAKKICPRWTPPQDSSKGGFLKQIQSKLILRLPRMSTFMD
ncbi:hypothetical protein AVEN_224891-1, partial [Araneus ventricosus]